MLYYHASQVANLKQLIPHKSNHNRSLVYFSEKRENTLVYLSNAVEKFCYENNIPHSDIIHKWASYGFDYNGILVLEEYYPNAIEETYGGVGGYIYSAMGNGNIVMQKDIPFAAVSEQPVLVENCEFISDAYEELNKMAEQGFIILKRFEDNTKEKLNWIENIIRKEYENHLDESEYCAFLRAKFNFLN